MRQRDVHSVWRSEQAAGRAAADVSFAGRRDSVAQAQPGSDHRMSHIMDVVGPERACRDQCSRDPGLEFCDLRQQRLHELRAMDRQRVENEARAQFIFFIHPGNRGVLEEPRVGDIEAAAIRSKRDSVRRCAGGHAGNDLFG